MVRSLLLFLSLASTFAWAQNVYEWVDAKGEHHFTDMRRRCRRTRR